MISLHDLRSIMREQGNGEQFGVYSGYGLMCNTHEHEWFSSPRLSHPRWRMMRTSLRRLFSDTQSRPSPLDVNPQIGIAKIVGQIKGYTAHALWEEFPWLKKRLPSVWTHSKFIPSVGTVTLEVVQRYIETQKGM